LMRRFYPELLTQTLRSNVRNFIKQTNLDTYECCCEIYDFVAGSDALNEVAIRSFARDMRTRVDRRSRELLVRGERLLNWLEDTQARQVSGIPGPAPTPPEPTQLGDEVGRALTPTMAGLEFTRPGFGWEAVDLFGVARAPVPYHVFRARLAEEERNSEAVACTSR